MSSLTSESVVWELQVPPTVVPFFTPSQFTGPEWPEPHFVIGTSIAETDWPRIHPGPLNAATGFRELPAAIEFDLTLPGDDWFRLDLAAREGSGPCPELRVEVNNATALLLPLAVRADRSHAPIPPTPVAGLINRSLWIPPGTLLDGTNKIVVTPIAREKPDPNELVRQQRPDLGSWFGSTLEWDRLELIRCPHTRPPAPRVTVEMLPLYKRSENGQLVELVDLVVEGIHDHENTQVVFKGGGFAFSLDLVNLGYGFGDVRLRMELPGGDEGFEAEVSVITPEGSATSRHRCSPARKWTLHILPHVHLDVGYTDNQAKVLELHSRNLDKALEILSVEPGWAFSIDGTLPTEEFTKTRSEGRAKELLHQLRSGRLSVNPFWAIPLGGVMTLEDMFRSFYAAAHLRSEHGVPLTYANITDVPSYPSALPSVLKAAGIGAFMGIVNHMRGGNADSDDQHLRSPMRWVGADGESVLAFFSDCYSQLRWLCADPPTVVGAAQGLTAFVSRYERDDYLPTDLPVVGTHADNEDLAHGYADFVGRWNAVYEWPRLRYSTIADYFASVQPLLEDLPILSGDGGSYWEDGVGTQAILTAETRRLQALLPAAECLSALVSAHVEHLEPPLGQFDQAWRDVLHGTEHTFTGSTSITRPDALTNHEQLEWKTGRIRHGLDLATDEVHRALSQLADLVTVPNVPAIIAFNPSSWERDLIVKVQIGASDTMASENRSIVAFEKTEEIGEDLVNARLRLTNVPAFGYEVVTVVASEENSHSNLCEPTPEWLDTPSYRVEISPDTGLIRSLKHKSLDIELVATDHAWSLGQLLYVRGGGSAGGRGLGDELSSLYDYDPRLPAPELEVVPATMQAGELRRTPWGWMLTSHGTAPTIPWIEQTIELFEDSDRVEVTLTFDKEAERAKESVYIAFPWSIAQPRVRYERQLGWVDPVNDHYTGACNEWLATQGGVIMSGDRHEIVWATADAPMFTVGDVVRGTWPRDFQAPNGALLSWVMNNYWWTNTPASQAGRLCVHYAFAPSRRADLAFASRFAEELRQRPLWDQVLITDRCDDAARNLPSTGRLYAAPGGDNVVVTIFPGRFGADFTVRVQETSGEAARVELRDPFAGNRGSERWAMLCSATEDPIRVLEFVADCRVSLDVRPFGVETVCFGPGVSPPAIYQMPRANDTRTN